MSRPATPYGLRLPYLEPGECVQDTHGNGYLEPNFTLVFRPRITLEFSPGFSAYLQDTKSRSGSEFGVPDERYRHVRKRDTEGTHLSFSFRVTYAGGRRFVRMADARNRAPDSPADVHRRRGGSSARLLGPEGDFRSDYWGRGLATEAAAVRDFAFHRLGLDRVINPIRLENAASRRVAEKIGMTRAKEIRRGDQVYWVCAVQVGPPDASRVGRSPQEPDRAGEGETT